jgi:hypothetical protein
MSSTLKHLRSSTASKRPTASGLADGQIGINTASGTPALFFKDSNGGVVKVGPAHVGSTAPNAVPAGSAGNSLGELWVNDGTTIPGLNYYTGSAFVNLTPSGTTAVAGLVELATDAETQTGTDTVRAVTPSGLQSKISDSTSTTSSTTIASATAVKAAYDLADAALPKAGGRVTGDLEIGPTGSLSFEGSSDDSFETTLAVVNPTADRTITFPNVTGTVVTTGDSGTVTSTMILDGTIVNADINASAGIVDTKLATIATAGKVSNSATTATSTNTNSAIVARDGSGNFSATTITAALSGNASTATALSTARTFALTGNVTGSVSSDLTSGASIAATIASGVVTSAMIVDGTIVNADVNASAAIAGTKISPDFGSQNIATTGLFNHALGTAGAPTITFTGDPNTGIYSPGADQVAISTNGTKRLEIQADGDIQLGGSSGVFFDATNNRLAIGTTTPLAKQTLTDGQLLCETSGQYSSGKFNSQNSLWSANTTLPSLLLNGGAAERPEISFYRGGNLHPEFSIREHATANTGGQLYAGSGSGAPSLCAELTASYTAIYTGSTERARIDSSGRLLIGTSTAVTGAPSGSLVFGLNNLGGIYGNGIVNTRLETVLDAGTQTIDFVSADNLGRGRVRVSILGGFNSNNREGYAVYDIVFNRTTDSVVTTAIQAPTNTGGTFTTSYTFAATKPDVNTFRLQIGKPSGAGYIIHVEGFIDRVTQVSASFA